MPLPSSIAALATASERDDGECFDSCRYDRRTASPSKTRSKPHRLRSPSSASPLPPLHEPTPAHAPLSVEERQSRQMRSFLQNFLSDERGHFHDVLDLHQHAIDTGITVTDATLQEVVNTVPELRGLRLTGCSAITDAGIWAIARQCTCLDTIYLNGCDRITDLGLRLLVHNCRLVTVDLSDCPQVTDSVLQTLAAGCWMLQTFIIKRSSRISDAGIVKIAQCCKDLRHLDVSECEHVGEYGDKALIEIGKYCSQLRVLDLFGCRHVQDLGVKAIAKGCPMLTTLRLTGCQGVSSGALQALAKQCHELEVLSLAGCVKTTNEDLAALARSNPRIHWLDVSGSPLIDVTGIRALATHCPNLSYLNISFCHRINDAALLELGADKVAIRQALTHLVVTNCPRVSERGVDALTDACPNLLTMNMTECEQIGRRFLQRLVQKLQFVEWASSFFGFQPLPNSAELCRARDQRLIEERSAVKIQTLMRGCLARGGVWQAKLRYVERKWLPRIQGRIRGVLTRKRLRAEAYERKKRSAAVLIVNHYRNWKLRRLLARHRRLLRIRANEEAAALIFQKIFRGYQGRKRVRVMRDGILRQKLLDARVHTMLELAAVKVQRAYRGHRGRGDAAVLRAAREANRRQVERENRSAKLLQRVYRGHQGRKRRAARLAQLLLVKEQHEGAIKMQKVFRGHVGRRNAQILRTEVEQLRRFDAALTIQRHWRGLKEKHLASVLIGLVKLRAREQEAALAIQRAYRIHVSRGFMKAMRLAQQLQRRRLQGAITIQRVLRGHRARGEAEVQRELKKLEIVARPLFEKKERFQSLVDELGTKVQNSQEKVTSDEEDEAMLAVELEKTMQIKTKYHDSSRITGTPQRYLTQYLQVQLADQLRAKRVELAMENRALETLLTQWNDAQNQLRAVLRELEPLTVGVALQTKTNRTRRLQTKVRRERVAATNIQRVFKGYRVRCAVREGANCWIRLPVDESQPKKRGVQTDPPFYYYNTFTGESRWQKPLAMTIFQDEFLQPMSMALATGTGPLPARQSASSQSSNWYEAFDDRVGQAYYFNAVTKEFQWEKPEATAVAYQTDTQTFRKRREWLAEQQEDGDVQQLIDSSELRGQLGEWEHRVDSLSEFAFCYHPPSGDLRATLSPRSVHQTLQATSSSSGRRTARSVSTTSPRPMLWQYRYGYEYDNQGQLVQVDADQRDDRPIWTEHVDEASGLPYYYNHITAEYRWEKPKEFGLAFGSYANTTNSSREWFKAQQKDVQEATAVATPKSASSRASTGRLLTERSTKTRSLGKKWVECVDPDSGFTYYYNEISGETRWSLSPRSARDESDVAGQMPLALYEQVTRLRESPVLYSARETHMDWLEEAIQQSDWSKVDVLVQQIQIREQSKIVEDKRAAAAETALPPGWSLYDDPLSGMPYFYNAIMGETRWDRPQ